MPIRMIVGDSSEKGKKRLTASSGAFNKDAVKPISGKNIPYAKTSVSFTPITKNSQFAGSAANSIFTQPMFFSPMHTPQNWQIASKRREIYQWSRFYYENEPKVAAGVDFYAGFPMNGFKLECKSKQILEYYEQAVEDLDLADWVGHISHEYFLIGDVFPFLEIGCPECEGKNPKCNHPGGYFKSIRLMNPDYIEVQDSVLADQPSIAMVPDEELRMLVQRREPKKIYDKLPRELIEMVSTGKPVPLSNRSISHLKYNGSAYGVYGTSMLRRLFTILAYKTKLMTANWIVAERLILPVRVVKVGDKDRPASEEDLADVANQLAAVVNDPNLSIITHHAFEYEWFGASGKIHNLTNEMEEIGKEILDGLMLNQSLLNGEMPGYNSAQVGVEIMIRRVENWRHKLSKWVENKIFKPIAMMQGFIDEERSASLGKTVYMYPTVKWNDLRLRDKTNWVQLLMQGYDKGMVSLQTVLEEMNLDYDVEIERRREETMVTSATGQAMPGGPGGGAGAPMGGGPGGGAPPGGPMGGDPGMPPPPGPEAGGAPPGGDMGAGGAPGGAPGMGAAAGIGMNPGESGPPPKVMKKGKSSKDEVEAPAPRIFKLTKLEQKMKKMLETMDIPYTMFGQYEIKMPGHPQPFLLDFAYPKIGVGIETDGAIWHERADLKARDKQRDQILANVGWRVLRFSEQAINEHMDVIRDIVSKNIAEAARTRKKAESENIITKNASVSSFVEDNLEEFHVTRDELDNGMGYRLIISHK